MQAHLHDHDEQVEQLLRAGDRAVAPTSDGLLQAVLVRAIEQAEAGPARRRRWLLAPAAVVTTLFGGLALTGALPAFAETVQHFVAETGVFGDGAGPQGTSSGRHYTEEDDSEWIDLTAKDFVPYAENLMPAYITLPADVNRARFAKNVARGLAEDDGDGRGAVMQVTGVRRSFEANAACVWYQTWEDADHDGDAALAHRAATQYDAAASWKEIVATDGGGVVSSMHRVHALALSGDWKAARVELGVDCTRTEVAAVTR